MSKTSDLPAAGAITGTELVAVVQGGQLRKAQVSSFASGGGGGGGGGIPRTATGDTALVAQDAGRAVLIQSAQECVCAMPSGLPAGAMGVVIQDGEGQVRFAPAPGASVVNATNATRSARRLGEVRWLHAGSGRFILSGDLTRGTLLWSIVTADTVERGDMLPVYLARADAALVASASEITITLGGTATDADLARPFNTQMQELAAANGCLWDVSLSRLTIPRTAPNPIMWMIEMARPAASAGSDVLTLTISDPTAGSIGRASSTAAVIDRWQSVSIADVFTTWTRTVAVAAEAGATTLTFTADGPDIQAGTRLTGTGLQSGTDAISVDLYTVTLSKPLSAGVAQGAPITCTPIGFDFDPEDTSRLAYDTVTGAVSAWTCGRTGVAVSQATAGQRPTRVANEVNGRAVVRFTQTGTPKWLQTGTGQADDLVKFMAAGRQAWTIYAVVKQDSRSPVGTPSYSLLHWSDAGVPNTPNPDRGRYLRSETSGSGLVGNPAMAVFTQHVPIDGQSPEGNMTAFRTYSYDIYDAAGQWTLYEVTCDGGAIEITVNGERRRVEVTLTQTAAIGATTLQVSSTVNLRRGMRLLRVVAGIPFSCDISAISGNTITVDAALAGHSIPDGTTLIFEDPIDDYIARTNALDIDRFAIGRHGGPTIDQLWSGDVARLVGVRGLLDFRTRIGLRQHIAGIYGITIAAQPGVLDFTGYEPAFCEVWPEGFKEWDKVPWRDGGSGWRSRYAADYNANVGVSRLGNGDSSVNPDLTVERWLREQNPFRVGRRGAGGLTITAEPLSGSLLTACQNDTEMANPRYQFRAGVATTVDAYWQEYGIWSCLCETHEGVGPGFVPAFWLLSQTKVWPPEIDIFEIFTGMPGVTVPTIHYRKSQQEYSGDANLTNRGIRLMTSQSRNRRVLYECKWGYEWIEFYVDRRFVGRIPTPFEFRTHMYGVCSLGTGSRNSDVWLGRPLPSQQYPISFTFHAVSAWRKSYTPPVVGVVPTSDADANAIIEAMTVPPSTARANAIRRLVHRLKLWTMDRGGTLWSNIGFLYVHAAHDRQAARIDWKTPARALAVESTANATRPLSWTADRGFVGNGLTGTFNTATGASGLDSGIVLSAGGMPFSPIEFAAFGLLASLPTSTVGTILEMGTTLQLTPGVGPSLTMRPNNSTIRTQTVSGSGPGFYAFNRNTYIITPQRNDLVPAGIWNLTGNQFGNTWAVGQTVKLATGTADVAVSGMCANARELDLRYLSDCLREYGVTVGIPGV